jgi:NADP-dependent 3-hydroxy acid dehydrogenase YdfG
MSRLEGLVALISGAAAGIGEGIAPAFISEGAVVMLTDIRDEKGQLLAESLGTHAFY